MNLGDKIVIVGVSASGKSTFARELGKKMHLPITFMDSIMWKSGWVYIGDTETVKKLRTISQQDKWIIEGYVSTEARTFLFDRADTIIYLDYPRLVGVFRYFKRWWKHRKIPRPELEGSPDTFDFKYLKLIWNKGEAISLNRFLNEASNIDKIVRLTSPSAAKKFIKEL